MISPLIYIYPTASSVTAADVPFKPVILLIVASAVCGCFVVSSGYVKMYLPSRHKALKYRRYFNVLCLLGRPFLV